MTEKWINKVKTANPEYMAERHLPFGNADLAQVLQGFRYSRQTETFLCLEKAYLLNLLSFRYETKATK